MLGDLKKWCFYFPFTLKKKASSSLPTTFSSTLLPFLISLSAPLSLKLSVFELCILLLLHIVLLWIILNLLKAFIQWRCNNKLWLCPWEEFSCLVIGYVHNLQSQHKSFVFPPTQHLNFPSDIYRVKQMTLLNFTELVYITKWNNAICYKLHALYFSEALL